MVDGNGKGIVVTPQDVRNEHDERIRRARKPSIGEVEDAMNEWARTLLAQYGPLAVEMRTLRLELQAIQRRLGPVVGTGDTE